MCRYSTSLSSAHAHHKPSGAGNDVISLLQEQGAQLAIILQKQEEFEKKYDVTAQKIEEFESKLQEVAPSPVSSSASDSTPKRKILVTRALSVRLH